MVVTDIRTSRKLCDQPLIQFTVFIILNRFHTCLAFTEPGFMDPALDGVLPAGNVFCVYEKRQTVLKGESLITLGFFQL